MSYSIYELLEEQKRRAMRNAVEDKEALKRLTDAELEAKIREATR